MMARRLIDTFTLGIAHTDGRWIAQWLQEHRLDLLDLIAGELEGLLERIDGVLGSVTHGSSVSDAAHLSILPCRSARH